MSNSSRNVDRTGQARRFGLLTLILIILVFGLARWEISLALIGWIIFLALIVLVVYYRSGNRRDY